MQATLTGLVLLLEEVLGWWLRQMRSLAGGWRVRPAVPPDAQIVAVRRFEEEPLVLAGELLIRRGGRETVSGVLDGGMLDGGVLGRGVLDRGVRQPPAGVPLGVRLPAGMVLRREVVLPLAAEREVRALLRHEMDRLTPFDADEVVWDIAELRRDAARGLRLTLIMARRQPVARLLEVLRAAALRPTFIESESGRIALGQPGARRGMGGAALHGLCAVLAVACLVVPVVRQQAALADVAGRIAALAPVQREAAGLRGRLAVAASSAAATRRSGDALRTLATLTAALPDGTWLSDLTLKGGDLVIDGQSGNAARLIALLAAARLSGPTFAAPVTRAVGGQADLFSIHATMPP